MSRFAEPVDGGLHRRHRPLRLRGDVVVEQRPGARREREDPLVEQQPGGVGDRQHVAERGLDEGDLGLGDHAASMRWIGSAIGMSSAYSTRRGDLLPSVAVPATCASPDAVDGRGSRRAAAPLLAVAVLTASCRLPGAVAAPPIADGVTVLSLDLVDTTRPTAAGPGVPAAAARSLPTTVHLRPATRPLR